MRTSQVWLLIGTCLLTSGCGIPAKGIGGKFCRTMILEPATYCESRDDRRSRIKYRLMADRAWTQFRQANGGGNLPPDYVRGFKAGFSEYLYAGGPGAPPPVPPRHYWNERWQTPQGHQAVENWYAGYRSGVSVAISQGYRACEVVPTSLTTACESFAPHDEYSSAMPPEPAL